jgi:general stress protein 26
MAMNQHNHRDHEGAQKLYEMIKDVKICMMTTAEPDGSLHSRPMYNQEADQHGDLWFFTKLQSPKVTEISKDRQVNLAFSDSDKQHYVSVAGVAEIVRDKAKIEEKWSEGLKAWFPEGTNDPNMALIRVHPHKGEYWDSPNSTLVHLYGYVKASLTGQSPTEMTEQKKVNLR